MSDQKPVIKLPLNPIGTISPVRPVGPVDPIGPYRPGPYRPGPVVLAQHHPPKLQTTRTRPVPFTDAELRTARGRPDRLTSFLVLKLTPSDDGTRGPLQAPQVPETLTLSRPGEPVVGFQLHAGSTYRFSATVSNLGKAPALMGFARLYVVDGNVLTANWHKEVPAFDMLPFHAAAGHDAHIRFNRTWIAPPLTNGLSDRISVFVHVMDLSGDMSNFVIQEGGFADRHFVRKDFHLS